MNSTDSLPISGWPARVAALAALLLLNACASYDGRGLVPGSARIDDVERVMGPPVLRWQDPDGTQQLAYPRGPAGFRTYMVHIGADGRLLRIENVLDDKGFAAVRPGMSKAQVLRVLGPSDPANTQYFPARDELVWDWRFCNDWNEPTRFYVLFDATADKVRTTMSQTESLRGEQRDARRYCGR